MGRIVVTGNAYGSVFFVLKVHLLFFFLKGIDCILECLSLLNQLLYPRTDLFCHVFDGVLSVRSIAASNYNVVIR